MGPKKETKMKIEALNKIKSFNGIFFPLSIWIKNNNFFIKINILL